MVQEIDQINVPSVQGQIELEEHSKYSKAKKVISGSLYLVRSGTTNLAPIDLKTAPNVGMNRSFRVISDADFYFKLSNGSSPAGTSDIYVPAKTAITIATRDYDHINVSGVGFIQATEVK